MRLSKWVTLAPGFFAMIAGGTGFAQDKVGAEAQARPIGNPGDWFVGGYPVEAMKARVEGSRRLLAGCG